MDNSDDTEQSIRMRALRQRTRITIKQEKFLQLIAQGMPVKQAYMKANGVKDSTAKKNAWRCLNLPQCQERLKEIEKQTGIRNEITLDEVVYNLRLAMTMAKDKERPKDLVDATVALGKIAGIVPRDGAVQPVGSHPFGHIRNEHGQFMKLETILEKKKSGEL